MLPLYNNQISLLTDLAVIHRSFLCPPIYNNHRNFVPQVVVIHRFDCSCNDDRLISGTTEKIEVSTKSLAVDDRSLDKSLIYTKNNRGPKIDPWGMPASTGDHEDDWPFNRALWNLFDRKLSMDFSGRLNIPRDYSLWIRPSCQTQSNALDMSKNIYL